MQQHNACNLMLFQMISFKVSYYYYLLGYYLQVSEDENFYLAGHPFKKSEFLVTDKQIKDFRF